MTIYIETTHDPVTKQKQKNKLKYSKFQEIFSVSGHHKATISSMYLIGLYNNIELQYTTQVLYNN